MITKKDRIAVVGATSNKDKFGYIVSKDLLDKEYDIVLINPKGGEILGKKVYTSLKEVEGKIDVVTFVVPPKIALEILKEVKELGIKKVWMQPGSESGEAITFCSENGIECIHNACIMMK